VLARLQVLVFDLDLGGTMYKLLKLFMLAFILGMSTWSSAGGFIATTCDSWLTPQQQYYVCSNRHAYIFGYALCGNVANQFEPAPRRTAKFIFCHQTKAYSPAECEADNTQPTRECYGEMTGQPTPGAIYNFQRD
jgi:hypothetical protein